MHGAAARRVGHTDVPDDILSACARLAKQCFLRLRRTSLRSCVNVGILLRDFADGPGMTSCHPVLGWRSSASPPAAPDRLAPSPVLRIALRATCFGATVLGASCRFARLR